ncbi:uncharacterized protein LALA0_S05e08658g [Lachancea lanzarotensis]|uniref:Dynactin subunit 4 n=1 Tax=Lachancea lanzarotensis TaxID=1245769 RepID=A0A0C7MY16_9SACH|nr:uncharacterized protein LALA0_S05e08658g [Lachancea lanzarotensis]CEP62574.1 LALA0S05e08658g1_1 [Lachancea lanzarotensis]
MHVGWICSCSQEPKSIYFLNVCRACQHISCHQCQKPELAVKFCPGCYSTVDSGSLTQCIKNCLECPKCQNQLVATTDGRRLSDKKELILSCHGCGWTYQTDELKNARSQGLALYFDSLRQKSDPQLARFRDLRAFYNTKRKLEEFEARTNKGVLETLDEATSRELAAKLQTAKLFELIDEEHAVPLPKRKFTPNDSERNLSLLPLPRRLKAKYNYKCPKCDAYITKVFPDPKSSRFVQQSFATDLVPDVKAVPLATVHSSADCTSKDVALVFRVPEQAAKVTKVLLTPPINAYLPVCDFDLKLENGFVRAQTPEDDIKQFSARIPSYLLSQSRFSKNCLQTSRNTLQADVVDEGDGWAIIPLHLEDDSESYQVQMDVSTNDIQVTLQMVVST